MSSPAGVVRWSGQGPIALDPGLRHLVVVHAIQHGWCGWLDTEADLLHPLHVG